MIIGFFVSRYTMSLGMAFLFGIAVINKDFPKNLKRFVSDRVMLAFSGVLLLYFVSGLYSFDQAFFWERMRIKVPFILLAFAFGSAWMLDRRWLRRSLYLCILLSVLSAFWVIGKYILNYEELSAIRSAGKYLPSPIHHIRLSLWIVFSIAASFYLFYERKQRDFQAWLLFAAAIFLIFFIHFFAVRSGLFSLYALAICSVFYIAFQKKKWFIAIAGIAVLVILPFVAYYVFPPLKDRIEYAKWDLRQFQQKQDISEHSDAKRLTSYLVAVNAIQYNPVFGSGIGDLKNQIEISYSESNPGLPFKGRLLPHNQFLFVSVGTGILGLLIFLYCMYVIFFSREMSSSFLVWAAGIIMLTSFFWEATLEDQHGTALFCICTLLSICYVRSEDS